MTTTIMSNYTFGETAYQEIPAVLASYSFKKIALIGGETALSVAKEEVLAVLEAAGYQVTGVFVYGQDSTQSNIDRLVAHPAVQEADVLFGFGGGRALDTSKMVSLELDKPMFSFPTICSNCAAGTAIAVVYKDDHSLAYYGYPKAPLHIFINTKIIAEAPVKYFWAGVGDGLSKGPEVERAILEAQKRGQELNHAALLGEAIAKSSEFAFYAYGEEAIEDVRQQRLSKGVEEIILSIIVSTAYASNLENQKDFDFVSAHAHAFYNATTTIPRSGTYLHGAVVAFGVMVLHAYYEEDDKLAKVAQFNQSIKLPLTLFDLGLTVNDVEELATFAITTTECRNTPFTKEEFQKAILKAHQYGLSLTSEQA
ncbi:iron-containing alcohol dehydrogenase family protein [Streptococcus sp. DD13]|uniref:iron-containing alcohol dehydrogenase family protein n=1 Tax=Streptococcus sp. DD13 TaxID=1777881 RepID=UPI00079419BE|nr:iron-containing alcohol dehydrogenase family protein [Streptococcus sp. DD13]KXT78536.1 Glycerol dehydrogenase [Streptococcus sp. DD13]